MVLLGCELGFSKITSHIIAHHYCIATKLLAGQSNLPPTYTTPNLQPTITLIDTNEVNKELRGMDLYLPINPFVMFILIHFPILHWKEKQFIISHKSFTTSVSCVPGVNFRSSNFFSVFSRKDGYNIFRQCKVLIVLII